MRTNKLCKPTTWSIPPPFGHRRNPFSHSFDAWIHTIDAYTGQDLLYLNHRGNIPPASVVKKGERRANPFKERKQFNSTDFIGGAVPSSLSPLDADSWEEEDNDKKQEEEMEG